MDAVGIDLHKHDSQVCVIDGSGAIALEQRIRTRPDRFTALLSGRARCRVLLEASAESEWVARHIEALGHAVVVADPNFAPMYAHRQRRIKTDRRDARALAEALRLGAFRCAHRSSSSSRSVRDVLLVRDRLVRNRTAAVNLVRSILRSQGFRLARGTTRSFANRALQLDLPRETATVISPLVREIGQLSSLITEHDAQLAAAGAEDPTTRRLMSVPGVGAVTAWLFASVIDDVSRFPDAHHLQSYLGLVPRERSSGEKQHRGRITKAGNRRLRALLVEAALTLLRSRHPAAEPIKAWAQGIALRRGKRIAVVAVARRLAGILFAMCRDQTAFGERAAGGMVAS